MSDQDENATTAEQAPVPDTDQAPAEPDGHDAALVAAVTAAQLSVCTEVVPEALQLRLAAAAALPEGQWRRTAGNTDPKVQALEAPYKRLSASTPADEPKPRSRRAGNKATGANRRRSTTTKKEK